MTVGFRHSDLDHEVFVDGADERECCDRLAAVCRTRGWPTEGWMLAPEDGRCRPVELRMEVGA